MNEETVLEILKKNNIDYAASLPCDKNKRLTALFPNVCPVITLAREEDGVGICAGLALTGKKAVMSIQSSGLGNMLNALLSLTCLYHLPLPILASWRGVQNEAICAQVPFNKPLPALLDVYNIPYRIFYRAEDLPALDELIQSAFTNQTPVVALILPSCWESNEAPPAMYPPRIQPEQIIRIPAAGEPTLTRAQAIGAVYAAAPCNALIISNIGVPSKELFAAGDRPGNFYMLGSYTQASAIGLGCALGCPKKDVYVIDGDGSLLGSAVLSVIAAKHPENLHIIALDNGTFGSTGNQISPAYITADIGLMARACGIQSVIRAEDKESIAHAVVAGACFIHVRILPKNSDAQNIQLTPIEIKERFMHTAQD